MTETWGAAHALAWRGMLPPTADTPKCPERAVSLTGMRDQLLEEWGLLS